MVSLPSSWHWIRTSGDAVSQCSDEMIGQLGHGMQDGTND